MVMPWLMICRARQSCLGWPASPLGRKAVNYYLAVKVGLIAIFLLPVFAGLPLPLSPIQIILLEMFMDLAACAGSSTGDGGRRRPL